MSFPWYTTMLLAAEASNVIGLRMITMSSGGQVALDEAHLMVSEKVAAIWEAGATLIGGGSAHAVVARYREHVAANASRLASA